MPNRTLLYIAVVRVCAVLTNGALFLLAPDFQLAEVRAVCWMAAIGLFVHVLTFRLPHSGTESIAFIPFLAAALIAPPWLAAMAVLFSIVLVSILRRGAVM